MERIGEEGFSRCDAVILCTAISSMEEVLPRLASLLSPGTLVMDTCSVKVAPTRSMQTHLPEYLPLLGTHPMFGPDSGKNGIAGLPLVLSPVRCPPEVTARWITNFHGDGSEGPHHDPGYEHDREAAYTQGVTHFIGRVLNELGMKESPMATTGYKELLKIVEQTCNDPHQLFLDLQKYNSYTRQIRLELKKALDIIWTSWIGNIPNSQKHSRGSFKNRFAKVAACFRAAL